MRRRLLVAGLMEDGVKGDSTVAGLCVVSGWKRVVDAVGGEKESERRQG